MWCRLGRLRGAEGTRDHGQRDQAEREVDVEDPPPGEVVDEETAQQRACDDRDPEDGAEEPLVAAAVARRDEIADDGHREHEQPAAAEALHGAEGDQLRHGLRQTAQRRAGEEDHECDLQQPLASVEIAELPVQRPDDRRGQQVGRHHPREVLEAAEVADDGRQRRRDDRLVERGDQQHEEQRSEDEAPGLHLGPIASSAPRPKTCCSVMTRSARPRPRNASVQWASTRTRFLNPVSETR